MPNYVKGANWDGNSWNYDAGREDPNHESDLDFDEVTRLIGTAVSVFPAGDIQTPGGAQLNAFKAALQSADTTITVVKGIHMRGSDPHIRASIAYEGDTYNYHVNLLPDQRSLVDDKGRRVGRKKTRFVWKAVQVSVKVDGLVYKCPAADPAPAPGNRRRGYSFTQGQMAIHIAAAQAAIAEREAQRRAKEEQARAAKLAKEQQAHAESMERARQADEARKARIAAGKNPWGM